MTASGSPPSLVVRADAGTQVGVGHLMRCIALGQSYADAGGRVTIVGDITHERLITQLVVEGFDYVRLSWSHPHGSDLATLLGILKGTASAAVLDGYVFDSEYQRAVRSECSGLLVIDDDAHLPHYHADILLNQNLGVSELSYHCDSDTQLLLGPQYALLRREFLQLGEQHPARDVPLRACRLLVTLGGGDAENVTERIVQAIGLLDRRDLEVVFVVGPANPWRAQLESAVANLMCAARIADPSDAMPALMAWAEMAVAAGGSTNWELCYLGVPTAVVVVAENQRRIAEQLVRAGAVVHLGWHCSIDPPRVSRIIAEILDSVSARRSMVERAGVLIDGRGGRRVIDAVIAAATRDTGRFRAEPA